MEKKIRQLLRYLQIEYVAVWVLPLLLVALYETGVMTEGAYAGDVRMDYVLQTVGILLAVGLIPLSLRLFSLSLVKNVKLSVIARGISIGDELESPNIVTGKQIGRAHV